MPSKKQAPVATPVTPADPAVLPAGVSAADMHAAIAKFVAILGPQNVVTDADHIAPYTKVMIAESEDLHRPSAVIYAREVTEIQQILKVCNEYKVPIWTISTGRNFGYGSAAPQSAGQVVLDLGQYGLDYVAEYIVGMRDMHHVVDVLYDRSDPDEMARAHECFAKLLSEFGKRGYAVYRVNTAFMDQAADLFGPVKRKIDQTLKRALDPNGILAPGKSGIRI